MPEDLQKWKRMQSDSMTSNIEALHMPIYTTSHLDLCILRASEDRVLPECHGLDSSLVPLKGHDWQHVLQVPYLRQ